MQVSTGADSIVDPTTLGSAVIVIGSWEKACKNGGSVMKSPTGRYSCRQDVMAIMTRRRVGTTTSPKPLTDKPDHRKTSCKDKQTSGEHVPGPS